MSTAHETVFWDSLKVLDNQHWITRSFSGKGEIEFSGNLRFSGEWNGTLSSKTEGGHLYVMDEAVIRGTIRVSSLSVEGTLDADVEVDSFRALKGSRIRGQIKAKTLMIDEGAVIEGKITSVEYLS